LTISTYAAAGKKDLIAFRSIDRGWGYLFVENKDDDDQDMIPTQKAKRPRNEES